MFILKFTLPQAGQRTVAWTHRQLQQVAMTSIREAFPETPALH